MAAMKTCVNCGTRVMARSDGTCPSCGGSADVKSEAAAAQTPAEAAKPAVGKGPMIGALIGVVVAAVLSNLSRTGAIDSMTVVTVLGALVGGVLGIVVIRAMIAARRRP